MRSIARLGSMLALVLAWASIVWPVEEIGGLAGASMAGPALLFLLFDGIYYLAQRGEQEPDR